jgi:hypothetical protein
MRLLEKFLGEQESLRLRNLDRCHTEVFECNSANLPTRKSDFFRQRLGILRNGCRVLEMREYRMRECRLDGSGRGRKLGSAPKAWTVTSSLGGSRRFEKFANARARCSRGTDGAAIDSSGSNCREKCTVEAAISCYDRAIANIAVQHSGLACLVVLIEGRVSPFSDINKLPMNRKRNWSSSCATLAIVDQRSAGQRGTLVPELKGARFL